MFNKTELNQIVAALDLAVRQGGLNAANELLPLAAKVMQEINRDDERDSNPSE